MVKLDYFIKNGDLPQPALTSGSPAAREILNDYLLGKDISFKELFSRQGGKIIPLPHYSFAKETHWHRAANTGQVNKVEQQQVQFYDQKNIENSLETFWKNYQPDDPILLGHSINDQKLLPGSYLLDMSYQIAFSGMQAEHWQLSEFVLASSFLVDTEPCRLQMTRAQQQESIVITLFSQQAEQHARAVFIKQKNVPANYLTESVQAISERCDKKLSQKLFYQQLKQHKVVLGKMFQVLDNISYNRNEIISDIKINRLPFSLNTTLPCQLIEGAFQLVACLLSETKDTHYLPFSIEKLVVHKKLDDEHKIYGRIEKESAATQFITLNLFILGQNGDLYASLYGVSFKGIAKALHFPVTQNPHLYYFVPQWDSAEVENKQKMTSLDYEATLFFVNHLEPAYQQGIVVEPGEKFSQFGPRQFTINPLCQSDYDLLFDALLKEKVTLKSLIYNWQLSRDFQQQELFFSEQASSPIMAEMVKLFLLVKSFLKTTWRASCKLAIIAPYNSYVGRLIASSTNSFLKVLTVEHPELKSKLIMISSTLLEQSRDLLRTVEKEMAIESPPGAVYYSESNERLQRQYRLIEQPTEQLHSISFRKKGIYLLAGGLGGIGQKISAYLSKEYQATLIILGRTPMNHSLYESILSIEQGGGRVYYISVDINDCVVLHKTIIEIKKRFGPLNGVIQLAGVLADNFFLYKSQKDFHSVLAPKIKGTLNIDRATADEPLDFFILFSSLASIAAIPGQCDYAAANGFLDEFAGIRTELVQAKKRKGHTIAINWPYWQEGQMLLSKQLQVDMQQAGLDILPDEQGLKALLTLMMQPYSQAVVVYTNDLQPMGNWLMGNETKIYSAPSLVNSEKNEEGILLNKHEEVLENYLVSTLADLIKLSADRISLSDPMEKFGLDSVLALSFVEKLQKNWGPLPKTLLFEHNTLGKVANYLQQNHAPAVNQFNQPVDMTIKESDLVKKLPVSQQIESLSEEMIDGLIEMLSD